MQKFGARGHTGKKLEVLDKYHGFYPVALKDKYRLIYIDAFAGTGHVLLSQSDEGAPMLPGLAAEPEILEGSELSPIFGDGLIVQAAANWA